MVADAALTSSSDFNSQTAASFSRLDTPKIDRRNYGGWSAKTSQTGEWIRVDLGEAKVIESVTTQGRADANQFVTEYTLEYSEDGANYVIVANSDGSGVKLFSGNQDRTSLVTHVFTDVIVARYVKLVPTRHERWISLRWDLSGCDLGENSMKIDSYFKKVHA